MEEVTGIFDIGKTNKKFLVFDKNLKVLQEESTNIEEIPDEDGMLWDDLAATTKWVKETFHKLYNSGKFHISRLNFSTFGASFVHLDAQGKLVTPLYSYLKTFPIELKEKFFNTYGGEQEISKITASPSLGMLNSGLQLYWLKHKKPFFFERVTSSLHYPQFYSYLFSGKKVAEKTSIGCHTMLWDYEKDDYHDWVKDEALLSILPSLVPCTSTFTASDYPKLQIGTGLHDSSASLIPYLASRKEPFVLISTGTWSICLNPFSNDSLTDELLKADCLNFFSYEGQTVRASRLFIGHVHDTTSRKIEAYFAQKENAVFDINPDISLINSFLKNPSKWKGYMIDSKGHLKPDYKIEAFQDISEAYHHLLFILVLLQKEALALAIGNTKIRDVLIAGGFSKSTLFTRLLAALMPRYDFCTAEIGQATALGAAIAIQNEDKTETIRQHSKFKKVVPF